MASVAETIETAEQHHKAGRLQQAERLYREVLQSAPDNPDALHLLGLIAHQQGRDRMAVDLIGKATAKNPQKPQFHNNIGVALKALGKLDEAISAYRQAVSLSPDYADAYSNMGNALYCQGRLDEAIKCYRQVVLLKPGCAEACNNIGIMLAEQGCYDAAVGECDEAIRLEPDYAEAYNTRGSALHLLGRYTEAIENYMRALRLRPDYAEAHNNLGMTLLLNGEFAKGWAECGWRLRTNAFTYPHSYSVGRWDGSSFSGRRLLVHYEQGLGDNIQFLRFMPMVKARGGTVILEMVKSLCGLLEGFTGVDELIEASPEKPKTEFDFYVSLLDLPGMFGTTLETIPNQVPYIYSEPLKSAYWQKQLAGDGFKVGIVWAGNPSHGNDRNRSCCLEQFLPLKDMAGVELYGLQKGRASQEIEVISDERLVRWLGEQLKDFTDTAAVIDNLDLVISVDTAVAHLAGAMGKLVWVVLPCSPDWRWMLGREDSPWYPSMRLFRQERAGSWADVFCRVAEQLQMLVESRNR